MTIKNLINSARRRRLAIALVVASIATVGVVSAALAAGRGAGDASPIPFAVKAQLRAIVSEAAPAYGKGDPATARAVFADRQSANLAVSGAAIPDDAAVWVVTLSGNFVAPRHPFGIAPATGAALTLVVDATTLTVTDAAITSTAPDLSTLGVVQDIGA